MSGKVPQAYFDKIKAFFNGDTTKTWMWFKSPNPALGMVSPLDMIRIGRTNRLMQFIDNALAENHRL